MHASPNPPLFCLVELTGLLAYRVPYNRPARTMPSGMEKPARRWLAAARCAVPQVHVVYAPAVSTTLRAPIVPGANVLLINVLFSYLFHWNSQSGLTSPQTHISSGLKKRQTLKTLRTFINKRNFMRASGVTCAPFYPDASALPLLRAACRCAASRGVALRTRPAPRDCRLSRAF